MDIQKNSFPTASGCTLRHHVEEIIQRYFASLKDEEDPHHVYDFFLDSIEEPLLRAVLEYVQGNQSEAARLLGISRGTLRAKLKKFDML